MLVKKADRIIAGLKLTMKISLPLERRREKGRPDYCGIETTSRAPRLGFPRSWKRQTGLLRDWNIWSSGASHWIVWVKKADRIIAGLKQWIRRCIQIPEKEWKRQTGLLRDWNIVTFRAASASFNAWKRQTGLLRDWNYFRPLDKERTFVVKKADRIIAGLKQDASLCYGFPFP